MNQDNIEKTPYVDPNNCKKLLNEILEMDQELEETVKRICLAGIGHLIPQNIYERYCKTILIMDHIGALLFKKSKYEDTKDIHKIFEDILIDLEEIEKNNVI